MSLFNLWKIVHKLSNKRQSHRNEESKQLYKCTKREVLYEESRVCWFNQAWIKEFGKNKNEIFLHSLLITSLCLWQDWALIVPHPPVFAVTPSSAITAAHATTFVMRTRKKKTKAGTIGKNSQEDWYRTPGKTWKTAQHCTFHSESKTCPNKISNCVRSMFIPAIADHKRSMIKNYVHDSCYFPLLADSRTDSGIIVCAIHWKGRHSENNLGGHRWPGIQKHRRQVKISMS